MQPNNPDDIYNNYSNIVYKYLLCLSHNETISEDLTQETFAVAFAKLHTFRYECKLSTWLCQIAKHLWFKQSKRINKEKNVSLEEIENQIFYDNDIDSIVVENEERRKFLNTIKTLEPNYKNVLYLKLIGDLSFIEISDVLNQTPNWARVTFYRAKQKLRKELENERENRL